MQRRIHLDRKRDKIIAAAVITLVILLLATLVFASQVSAPKKTKEPSSSKTVQKTSASLAKSSTDISTDPVILPPQSPTATPASDIYSDPRSTSVVVNKRRPIQPLEYAPADLVTPNVPVRANISSTERQLRSEPAGQLEKLIGAAAVEGVSINLQSGYRSYYSQASLYNSYVRRDGQAQADTYSARPGHSEHQTGLSVDLGGVSNPGCNVASCFAQTSEGQWLALHAHEYGYVIRYTAGKESITGYQAEPWHFRYVGTGISNDMRAKGITTLEELFGLPAAPNYQ